ncbi:MAG: hypothetical protein US69_C0002G0066 [candidate division TM6 bacterium GW2011_GWF2_38_10]|nr:MAG: hypothetical protein US69_C0002G0066 [candidate division TM6 bacterium GW2011_GWF2_38_10]
MFLKNYILILSFITTSCCAMNYNAATQQSIQEHFIDAIITRNLKKCRACINHGANVNQPIFDNIMPLTLAIQYNNPRICKLLIDNEANIEAKNKSNTNTNTTKKRSQAPLNLAPKAIQNTLLPTSPQTTKSHKKTQPKKHNSQYTVNNPLHYDIYNNDLVSFLLRSIAQPNLIHEKNEFNQNALDIAMNTYNILKTIKNPSPHNIQKCNNLKTMITVLAYSMCIDIPAL